MSALWEAPLASKLGFPAFDSAAIPDLQGSHAAWVPGMKATGTADYYWITWHRGDLRRYQLAGGDMSRVVVHHLTYDKGVITPLWGRDSFLARVEQMKELGVKYVVAPDFSSWADLALPVQLHNYYRSAVVACDLTLAGFGVLPLVAWSHPSLTRLSLSMWPEDMALGVVDATHVNTLRNSGANAAIFWNGLEPLSLRFPSQKWLVWANSPKVAARVQRRIRQSVWVPSRSVALAALTKHLRHCRTTKEHDHVS